MSPENEHLNLNAIAAAKAAKRELEREITGLKRRLAEMELALFNLCGKSKQ